MLLPPPDISAAYVDDKRRPSKDFYNWIKSIYDTTRSGGGGGGGGGGSQWWVNVVDFGAVGNGVADDTTAILAAIASLGTSGGRVIFPPGVYNISSTIAIGDGSAAAASTIQGITLASSSGVSGLMEFGGYLPPTVLLNWVGGASPMIEVRGPLTGWGIRGIALEGNHLATIGLHLISAQFGISESLSIDDCINQGIKLTTVGATVAVSNSDCLHNNFTSTFIAICQSVAGSEGILLTNGGTNADADLNQFFNTYIDMAGNANGVGVRFEACDANQFYGLHISGASASGRQVVFDYTGVTDAWPASNAIFWVDTGGTGTPWSNIGTPAINAATNSVYGIAKTNGGNVPVPTPDNLAFFGDDHIVLQSSFSGANTQQIDIQASDASDFTLYYVSGAGTNAVGTGDSTPLDINTNDTQAIGITTGQAVSFPGVGTTASAANAFLNNAAGNNLLRSTSSLRYKEAVTDIPAARINAIRSLKPIEYRSKGSNDDKNARFVGYAAEDVYAVDPSLVHMGYAEADMELVETMQGVHKHKKWRPKPDAKLVPDNVMYDRLLLLQNEALKIELAELKSELVTIKKKLGLD